MKEELLKNILFENYGIIYNSINKIENGTADVYNIDNLYVLKIYQKNFDLSRVKNEIKVTEYLKKDLIVPRFLINKYGKYYSIHDKRIIVLMEYISGYSIEAFKANKSQILDSANTYGKLIKKLQTYRADIPYYNIEKYTFKNINKTIKKLQTLITRTKDRSIIDDLKYRLEIIDNLKNIKIENISIIICHGDYYISQCIYKNEKIKAILDFSSIKKMPVSIELIRSYIYLDNEGEKGSFSIDGLVDYVKEFSKYYKLNLNDLKYMPHLYLIKLLRSDFGYKEYIENDDKKEDYIAIGKKLQSQIKFIYNNLDKISEKLKKI